MQPLLAKNPDIWFVDETTVRLATTLRKVVAPKGSKPRVLIRQDKKGVHLLGALRKSGKFLLLIARQTPNQHTIKRLLRQIKRFKGKGRLYIVWDNAGEHIASAVRKTARKLGIHLIQQPAHAPELQPVEEVWHQLKKFVGNYLFSDLDDIIETSKRFFAQHRYHFELEVVNYFV